MLSLFPLINLTEEKQTEIMGWSKNLPFDKLKAEFFYPSRVENQDTYPHVIKVVVELANCLLAKLLIPRRRHQTTSVVQKENSFG